MTTDAKDLGLSLSEEQIKHMVDRFLGWKLPENFRPDGGVQFDADAAKKLNPMNLRYEPYGTNLLDATQAEAMVRHIIEGMPAPVENTVGAAEAAVGRYIYRRIEALMDAKPGTPEGAELQYLAKVAEAVEEWGEDGCGSEMLAALAAPLPIPSSPRGEERQGLTVSQSQPIACPSARPKAEPSGADAYGCHVDLAPDEEPDGCVIDYGAHGDCVHAIFPNGRLRRKKHTCPHWKPIANVAPLAAGDHERLVKEFFQQSETVQAKLLRQLLESQAFWKRSAQVSTAKETAALSAPLAAPRHAVCITLSPNDPEVGNAVVCPEPDDDAPYWTLVAQGGEATQNAIGAEIVRRWNAFTPLAAHDQQTEGDRSREAIQSSTPRSDGEG